MTSLVLGDLIQDSLTPSVKAPLGSLKANSVQKIHIWIQIWLYQITISVI
jgi:hypothetical protein